MSIKISSLITTTFRKILYILNEKGKKTDDLIINMTNDASNILHECDKSKVELTNELMDKIKKFYSKKEYLILTNYFSEIEYKDLKMNIDKTFFETIKDKYSSFEFNYNYISNTTSICNHKKNLDDYINQKKRFYKRMKYSSLHEILKYNLNDEINIFAFSKHLFSTNIRYIQKFKNRLENLNQKIIIQIIKEILNENDFYEHYFSILNSKIIKSFFTSELIINKNVDEFCTTKEKLGDSGIIYYTYLAFLNQYNKKNNNYRELKNLILLKILPNGDRAYTLRYLKKIIINPTQFFIGKELKEDINIKAILKSYLIIILLQETVNLMRVFDESNKVSPLISNSKQGERIFIKYIFGVSSINHINLEQANSIFDKDTWKNQEKLKNIFSGQLENIEEDNINEFLINYFKDSISFFPIGANKIKLKSNSYLDNHFRK